MAEEEFKRKSMILKRKLLDSFKEVQAINEKGRAALKDKEQQNAFKGMFKVIEKYYSRFENLWEELNDLYENEKLSSKFPLEEDLTLQGKAKRYYYEVLTSYEAINSETAVFTRRSINPNESLMCTETRSNRNLPRINLPHFNGQITNWPKFRDAFTSIIHTDALLSKMEKFHYLVSSLVGTASAVISNLPLIEDNYDLAWKALNDTFDNKRMLASNYLNQLMGFKPQQGKTTVDSLQYFLSQVSDNIAAFKLLKIPDEGDFILFHIAVRLLDPITREQFEIQNKGKDFPVFNDLTKFLRERCLALQLASGNAQQSGHEGKSTHAWKNASQKPSGTRTLKTSLLSSTQIKTGNKGDGTGNTCFVCQNGSHALFKCIKFMDATVDERHKMLKSWRGCRNCLSYGHPTNKCNSKWNCKVCKRRHNSILHVPVSNDNSVSPVTKEDDLSGNTLLTNTLAPVLTATLPEQSQVILGTVVAEIQDVHGTFSPVRLVVDSGSQHSFITKKCLNKLGLKSTSFPHKISAIGQTVFDGVKSKALCCLKPRNSQSPIIQTEALVVNNITSHLPNFTMPSDIWSQYTNFELADPTFWQPGPVEFLLGSDLYADIWNGSPLTIQENQPKLFSSIFGYIVIGRVPVSPLPMEKCTSFFTVTDESHDLRKHLQRFWELEEPPMDQSITHPEDEACEIHFKNTHSRLDDGQYVVRLPFKTSDIQLGNFEGTALKRFYNLERRLTKEPLLQSEYNQFMRDYVDLGHMHPTTTPSKYIIPHHCVVKEDRSQIKLRVVFDASAQSPPLSSLNHQLMGGPKLQKDIRDILLRFRMHPVVFVADIVKMYRQIKVHPDDRPYQHIYWRFNPADSIETYELCTVTYGLTSAPFLALRVMQQLALDEGENYPKAAQVISNDMYVDDIVTGAASLSEALTLQKETIDLLEKGHFCLSKWASNRPELLHTVTPEQKTESVNLSLDEDSSIKILGLHWDPMSDVFMYKLQSFSPVFTKRAILSAIAKVYDPLGFLAPLVFTAKCLIQNLWKLGIDWDSEIPSHLRSVWNGFVNQLDDLSQLHISRLVIPQQSHYHQIVGFCDASAQGYCAALYLRSVRNDDISSHLIIAKTKLAPIKVLSIPRLELCGAHLLAKLYFSVSKVFVQPPTMVFQEPIFFTDASVVLGWLNIPPYKLKVFISNRVSHITELTSLSCWRHVSSKDNPSDHGSRGLAADKLVNCKLWWNGPDWLCKPEEEWPQSNVHLSYQTLPEIKVDTSSMMATDSVPFIIAFISSQSMYYKVLYVVAWMRRLIYNLKARKEKGEPRSGPLESSEMKEALTYIIIQLQLYYIFQNDASPSNKESIARSKYPKLSPFFDENGVLRVGGRLNRSSLPVSQKHPVLLPKCHFTTLLVDYYHRLYLHPGPSLLQALLQLRYWIPSLRCLVRHRTFKCLSCYKGKADTFNPKMADLPPSRVSSSRAFLHLGMDFAGPFLMRESLRRKAAVSKAYLCIFVCMATKAVHLEIVTALSTDAFMAAFQRFTSRRGLPEQCYSDCGTNFQGAANKLREFGHWYCQESTQNEILHESTKLEIKWNFNPPHAPHFGGLWEAAVKSAKSILRKVAGETPLTYEELTTWIVKIEAVLNSRPLCPLSSAPEETDFLSPGHFLIGSTLLAPPEPSFLDSKVSTLSRWQLLQKMTQHFWQRWRVEYLTTLNRRNKWTKDTANPNVGDLVLLKDPNVPVLQWPLARILKVHPGEDGVVRVMTVKCGNTELKRPAVKLIPLLPLKTNHFE